MRLIPSRPDPDQAKKRRARLSKLWAAVGDNPQLPRVLYLARMAEHYCRFGGMRGRHLADAYLDMAQRLIEEVRS
jgi:hypothetical protein